MKKSAMESHSEAFRNEEFSHFYQRHTDAGISLHLWDFYGFPHVSHRSSNPRLSGAYLNGPGSTSNSNQRTGCQMTKSQVQPLVPQSAIYLIDFSIGASADSQNNFKVILGVSGGDIQRGTVLKVHHYWGMAMTLALRCTLAYIRIFLSLLHPSALPFCLLNLPLMPWVTHLH